MEPVQLGKSGLRVSPIILGCMSYGDPDRGGHTWTLPEAESRPFIQRALELGITTFDTADIYSDGTSEEIVGRALRDFAKREEIVIATKVNGKMYDGGNGFGLSRTHIMTGIDASLKRLGTDYVDLYQIHRFDPTVPVEETMQALHDVVKAGKARYIGASSMFAWQFAKMQAAAELNNLTKFISMQDQYNLLMREEEREMLPLCVDQGVGVIPWSPLARGYLTRPWGETTTRAQTDQFGQTLYRQHADADQAIVAAVEQVAAARGVPMAQVALAWVRQQPAVTAPIVGATKISQLEDAVASLEIELTPAEMALLEAPYRPQYPEGF